MTLLEVEEAHDVFKDSKRQSCSTQIFCCFKHDARILVRGPPLAHDAEQAILWILSLPLLCLEIFGKSSLPYGKAMTQAILKELLFPLRKLSFGSAFPRGGIGGECSDPVEDW